MSLETARIMFWIGFGILIAIFIICIIGICYAHRMMHTKENVVSADDSGIYPATRNIRFPRDYDDSNIKECFARFVIEGNTAQFVNANAGDIIFVKNEVYFRLNDKIPRSIVVNVKPESPRFSDKLLCYYWGWANANDKDFEEVLDFILKEPQFYEMRMRMGDRCPSKEILIETANDERKRYLSTGNPESVMITTVYCAERNRLEFRIFPYSDLYAVAAFITHRSK